MEDGKRALWTKLVADFELSGLSQRAFASERGISLSNLGTVSWCGWSFSRRLNHQLCLPAQPSCTSNELGHFG